MLKFDNLKIAFEDKSDKDLNRAYLLFKTLNNPIISNTLTIIIKIAIWLRLPIDGIIKSTVYKHFCGGTTIENSQETINKLWRSQIGTILDFSAEVFEVAFQELQILVFSPLQPRVLFVKVLIRK